MIRMTYDDYDKLEEACTRLREENEKDFVDEKKEYNLYNRWPKLEELEAMDLDNNLKDYFHYLFFWYTQKIDHYFTNDKVEYEAYKKSMKYLKQVIDRNIVFID